MRESAARRLVFATLFALAAGLLVYLYNPMNHVRADLRADAHGVKVSFEVATQTLESCARRLDFKLSG